MANTDCNHQAWIVDLEAGTMECQDCRFVQDGVAECEPCGYIGQIKEHKCAKKADNDTAPPTEDS